MKQLYCKCILSATALLLVTGCVRDPYLPVTEVQNKEILSIEEAKRFFENDITRSGRNQNDANNLLVPAEFTPMWQKAVTSSRSHIASVDVPIISSHNFKVMRSDFYAGRARAYTVDIHTKLIVVKDVNSNKLGQYVMSIIPDEDYAKKHKDDLSLKIINTGNKRGFSGLIIYSDISSGIPVRIDSYEKGSKISGVSVFGGADYESLLEELRGMRFARRAIVYTRNGEDEWPDNDIRLPDIEIPGYPNDDDYDWPDPNPSDPGDPYDPGAAPDNPNENGGSGNPGSGGGGNTGGGGSVMPEITTPTVYIMGKGPYTYSNFWNLPWYSWVFYGSIIKDKISFTYDKECENNNPTKINDWLNALLKDCLGSQLVNILKGLNVDINMITVKNATVDGVPVNGVYSPDGRMVVLSENADIGTFFEELYHAYQFNKPGADMSYLGAYPGNTEIEAKMAKYLFLKRNGYASKDAFTMTSIELYDFVYTPDQHNWDMLELAWAGTSYGGKYVTSSFNKFRPSPLNINCKN